MNRPCALRYGIADVPPFPGQERFLLFTHLVVVPFIDGGQIVLNSRAASPELRTASAFLASLLTEPGSGRQSESSAPPELPRPGMPPGRLALTRW
jgi:hypothetical protein